MAVYVATHTPTQPSLKTTQSVYCRPITTKPLFEEKCTFADVSPFQMRNFLVNLHLALIIHSLQQCILFAIERRVVYLKSNVFYPPYLGFHWGVFLSNNVCVGAIGQYLLVLYVKKNVTWRLLSWLPFERFSWKYISCTLGIVATYYVHLFAIGQ
jgi:hypothetical protein